MGVQPPPLVRYQFSNKTSTYITWHCLGPISQKKLRKHFRPKLQLHGFKNSTLKLRHQLQLHNLTNPKFYIWFCWLKTWKNIFHFPIMFACAFCLNFNKGTKGYLWYLASTWASASASCFEKTKASASCFEKFKDSASWFDQSFGFITSGFVPMSGHSWCYHRWTTVSSSHATCMNKAWLQVNRYYRRCHLSYVNHPHPGMWRHACISWNIVDPQKKPHRHRPHRILGPYDWLSCKASKGKHFAYRLDLLVYGTQVTWA